MAAPDLEERVAALEAALAMLASRLLQSGNITINTARAAYGLPPFREPWADEPEFMAQTRTEPLDGPGTRAVRLTHEPTGVTVEAPTRSEAVAKLGRALKRRGIPGAA